MMIPKFLRGVGKAASPNFTKDDEDTYDYRVTKTCTFEKCEGNDNPKIWYSKDIIANNLGLPNPGISYYEHNTEKHIPTVLSVHPDCFWNRYDFSKLPSHIKVLEVNISCPNTTYGMIGYNVSLLYQLLKLLPYDSFVIGLKLPYYADRIFAEKIGRMCVHAGVHYVVCCNTFSGFVFEDMCDASSYRGYIGHSMICGVSSQHFKHLVLANCKWFVDLGMNVIGCGGIISKFDIALYRQVGCIGVQMSGAHKIKSSL